MKELLISFFKEPVVLFLLGCWIITIGGIVNTPPAKAGGFTEHFYNIMQGQIVNAYKKRE